MASMSRKQREDLAATRIMRVLSSLTMANQRGRRRHGLRPVQVRLYEKPARNVSKERVFAGVAYYTLSLYALAKRSSSAPNRSSNLASLARARPAPSPSRRPKRNRRCPLLPTKPMPRLTPGRAPTRACWVDLMAAGLAEPRCTSERGLAMGGGRPAERRFTVRGSSKSVARCHRSVLAYCHGAAAEDPFGSRRAASADPTERPLLDRLRDQTHHNRRDAP